MREPDERRLRPRSAKPGRSKDGERFSHQVLRAAQSAGGVRARFGGPRGRGGEMGRGRVAARMAGERLARGARRVVVKARLVVFAKAAPGSTLAHLRYIQRDGVTPSGEPGRAYGAQTDRADVEAFEARGRDDRHQFRFIVSAEDAGELGDLQAFTRDLMGRMEADLGTRLDWIAVDHRDTDNPHTHLVLRGVDEQGADLIIARDYISHGLRQRAGELATELLGPQTEQEIRARLAREVEAQRWTGNDRQLTARAVAGGVDLAGAKAALIGRAQVLERLGLAERVQGTRWRLRTDLEPTLRAMGERGDIVRTMQRAFAGEARHFEVLHEGASSGRRIGRVVAKGLSDELGERGYLVLDGVDGKAHYLALPPSADLAGYKLGAIVGVEPVAAAPRASDRAIAAVAEEGIYSPARHLEIAQGSAGAGQDPQAFVQAHLRRLEALRRAGAAERLDAERWQLPEDFLARAGAYEAGRFGGARIEVLGDGALSRQARLLGVTWLDQALVDSIHPAATGFGAESASALAARRAWLVDASLLPTGAVGPPSRSLLAELRRREVAEVGHRIEAQSGLAFQDTKTGQAVRGRYARSIDLVSGRFAVIDEGRQFRLVPWSAALDRRIGATVRGVVRSAGIAWELGRNPSPTILR